MMKYGKGDLRTALQLWLYKFFVFYLKNIFVIQNNHFGLIMNQEQCLFLIAAILCKFLV